MSNAAGSAPPVPSYSASSKIDAMPSVWIVASGETPEFEIWGLSCRERLRRGLERAGCRQIEVLEVAAALPDTRSTPLLLLRDDFVYDERLIEGLLARENLVLLAPETGGVATAAHVDPPHADAALALLRANAAPDEPTPPSLSLAIPDEIASAYTAALRKFASPYLYRPTGANLEELEARIFSASYKGVTDLITKWLWPRPAAAATRVFARARVHPNTVTLASWVLTILAFWLFLRGNFAAGLVAAWGMTFLDTVDGKLARVTLTSSRIGHVLDHGLDLVHPPFWWLAWGFALPAGYEAATAIVVGGYFVGRALEGVFLLAFGMEIFCWRPIDSLFRTIVARRNPNLIFLTVGTLGGRPDLGLVIVAIWTGVCTLFHGVRIAQAFASRRRGATPTAWDEVPDPVARPTGESG